MHKSSVFTGLIRQIRPVDGGDELPLGRRVVYKPGLHR
jgi:hypothetical protein